MARPKEFDEDAAIDAAVGVFREHGYEGTSAQMLVDAMGIGRQSLYNTFGDKWGIYRAAVRRYGLCETNAHREALASRPAAIDGIRAMLERVVGEAERGCLGVGSIVEFGQLHAELTEIRTAIGGALRDLLIRTVERGQAEGDIAIDLDPATIATFIVASIAGLRIAARGGASPEHLAALVDLALRALR
ncbi:TetR/AcrR family transcriptional regulator [Sphingomonas sp. NFR15]|uniref:TetR/AcrR family transcriptional regulator n=1 Tax=Sphingomonas sp. NFR15 TaxID=1566282 RepID=UPI00087FA43A|nr:TetR/AcrR family transcriptional regulator [Sphingomonas sp. NFR15]SDA35389.1 transcriptional regulator, TetR family [Sphingomonas sp. NFR15]